MQLRPTSWLVICLWLVAFAYVANVTIASDFEEAEDPAQTVSRLYDQLHSRDGPVLQPEETLSLMKQLLDAHHKFMEKEEKLRGEKEKAGESIGEDDDKNDKNKKKSWVAKMEILIEFSNITNKKCTKESFWDLSASLSYHNVRPNFASYLTWCIGNQFAECKATMVRDLKEKASDMSPEQMNDLDVIVDCIKQVDDTSRDGYMEALAMFFVKQGKDKDMLSPKKAPDFYKKTVYDMCENMRSKLKPEFGLFEKLSLVQQAVEQMDLETQQLSEKIRACGYIVYEIDQWGTAVHKLMLESVPKEPSNFNNMMRRLFARGKARKETSQEQSQS